MSRIAHRLLAVALFGASCTLCRANSTEDACGMSTVGTEGLPVGAVRLNGVVLSPNAALPLKLGRPLSSSDQIFAGSHFYPRNPPPGKQVRLNVSFSFDCLVAHANTGTVDVQFWRDRILLTDADTTGRVLDEADGSSLMGTRRYPRFEAGLLRDTALGNALFASLGAEGSSPTLGGATFTPSASAWRSVDNPFYHAALDLSSRLGTKTHNRRFSPHTEISFDRSPFASGRLRSKSARMGTGYQSGWRWLQGTEASVNFRLSVNNLDLATGSAPRVTEQAAEGSLRREVAGDTWFVRAMALGDTGHTGHGTPVFGRVGAAVRTYKNFSLTHNLTGVIDTVASGGHAFGTFPAFRAFVAGNAFEPPLLDSTAPPGSFTWFGPLVRGYGIGQVTAPGALGLVRGASFLGLSSTVALPLFSKLAYPALDLALRRPMLRQSLQNNFSNVQSRLTAEALREGANPDDAENRSYRQTRDVYRSLTAAARHTMQASIRPLLAADVGSISASGMTRTVWSAGVGARFHLIDRNLEVLYFWNGRAEGNGTTEALPNHQIVLRIAVAAGLTRLAKTF